MLHRLADQGVDNILVVPVSFVSDHLETLYEIDILYGNLAEDLQISHFHRAPTVNTHPQFIQALTKLIKGKYHQHQGAPLAV
jgi:protoporphyrin/coproporphyrin ferrochelatase